MSKLKRQIQQAREHIAAKTNIIQHQQSYLKNCINWHKSAYWIIVGSVAGGLLMGRKLKLKQLARGFIFIISSPFLRNQSVIKTITSLLPKKIINNLFAKSANKLPVKTTKDSVESVVKKQIDT